MFHGPARIGRSIHLDLPGLTGKDVIIYGQQEVVKDLIGARLAAGQPILFEATATALDDLDADRLIVHYRNAHDDNDRKLDCDFVAGCDGFHGISQVLVRKQASRVYERTYDFAWLGVLARARPIADMTYSNSDRGFALCSRRSMAVSRLYLQVGANESPRDWSDERFWEELHARMHDVSRTEIVEGEIFQRDLAHLRAVVMSPMQYGRLFLAGDAAHIVPPTGAKGLNLAVADARVLARGITELYHTGSREGLDRYSERCLRRVWKVVRFSTMLTNLLHRFPEHTPIERELQLAELDYIAGSRAAQTSIAEQYVGIFGQSV